MNVLISTTSEPASPEQIEEICRLLNHPTFSRDDKAGVLRSSLTLSTSGAKSTIDVLTTAREAYDQGHEDPDGDGTPLSIAA